MHCCNLNWSIWTLPGLVVGWPHSNCFLSCVGGAVQKLWTWTTALMDYYIERCAGHSSSLTLDPVPVCLSRSSRMVLQMYRALWSCVELAANYAAAIPIRSTVAAVFGDVPLQSACSFRPYLVIGPTTWLALSLKQLNINELSLRWLQISVTRCNGWHAGVLSWPGWFIGPLEMSIKLLILQGIRGRQGIQSTICAMRFIEVTSQHPEWPSENINITTTRSIRPLPSSLGSSKSLDHFQEIWIPWERIDGAVVRTVMSIRVQDNQTLQNQSTFANGNFKQFSSAAQEEKKTEPLSRLGLSGSEFSGKPNHCIKEQSTVKEIHQVTRE